MRLSFPIDSINPRVTDPMTPKKPTRAKAVETKGKNLKDKLDQSGLNTRVKGHLSSTAKRQQAKRDGKNPS